jgi:hypothetical protein
MSHMSERAKSIISRSAMLALAMLLILGGTTCVRSAAFIYRDEAERRERLPMPARRQGGAFVAPGLLGVAMIAGGALVAALAVLPLRWLHRVPPNPRSTLHDNPDAGNPRGPWR